MTMMDDFDFDDIEMEEGPPPEEASNRTFLLVAGILGAILILSLILMAVYAMVVVPQRRAAQNTQVALASGLTAEAQSWTATPTITRTPLPMTATPSPTLVLAPTDTPAAGLAQDRNDQLTATMAALFTQQAANLLTVTPLATELPSTGFADDIGLPGMLSLAGALILIIFFARRLRTAR